MSRTFTPAGLSAMLLGVGLVAFELRYNLLLYRLGMIGRIVLIVCATGFSVWGLKELIAGWWPGLGRRRFVKHRSGWPVEGRIYIGIMIVLFAGALVGSSNPLVLVFAMMAGPFVINGWVSFTLLKKLSVDRRVPPRVMAGEPTSIEIVVRNDKRWVSAWVMVLRDQISGRRERISAEVVVPRVSCRSERRTHYRLRLMNRGEYSFGPMSISTRFPLGLVERGLTVAKPDRILVYPRIGRLTGGWNMLLQQASDLVPQMTPRSGPFDDEFHKLREYRFGDDIRAIHWKTSARCSELMVREFRESRDRNMVVLLDAWQPERPTPDDRERVELAISFAATVCVHHLHKSRDSYLKFSASAESAIDWNSGAERLESLLDGFALLRPSSRSNLTALWEARAGADSVRARILLVTTRPDDAAAWLLRQRAQAAGETQHAAESTQIIGADAQRIDSIVDWRIG